LNLDKKKNSRTSLSFKLSKIEFMIAMTKKLAEQRKRSAPQRTSRETVTAQATIRDHKKSTSSKRTSKTMPTSQTSLSETHHKSLELFLILVPPTPGYSTIKFSSQAVPRKSTLMTTPSLALPTRPHREP
jgi:hypothetical protein